MSNGADVAVLRVEAQERKVQYTLSLAGDATGPHAKVTGEVSWPPQEAAAPPHPGAGHAGAVTFGNRGTPAPPPLPDAVERRLRQWALSCPGGGTLHVQCAGDKEGALTELAWEELRSSLPLDGTAVVRLAGAGAPEPPWLAEQSAPPGATTRGQAPGRAAAHPQAAPVLLIAGWPRHRGRAMAGITRELTDLAAGLGQARVTVVARAEPTVEELAAACKEHAPAVLHLAHAGVGRAERGGEPEISVPGPAGGAAALGAREVLAGGGTERLALVVVNASGGDAMARALSERLGVLAVGWGGAVGDEEAADFSFFFYQRLLEGLTAVQAVEAYRRQHAGGRTAGGRHGAMQSRESARLVLWSPAVEATAWSLPRGGRGPDTIFRGGGSAAAPGAVLRGGARADGAAATQLELVPAAAINPALLLNGRPALQRLSVDAPRAITGARLRIECDTGAGTSVHRESVDLAPGMQALPVETVQFPVLYELLRQGAPRRYVSFSVRLSEGERLLSEATASALWMGPNEWMDQPETWAFIPAFVQPASAGVQRVLDKAVEVLRLIGEPSFSFSGYQPGSPEIVRLQVKALFQTLRDKPFELTYINPPSGAVYLPGSPRPQGQRVRLADEVIEHRRGTCHDLALLFASCLEHVGIHPLIVLLPGHTFFGFWTRAEAHAHFWASRPATRAGGRGEGFGEAWMLRDGAELVRLVEDGAVDVVEATSVTNREATYAAACAAGRKHLEALTPSRFDAAIDVVAARWRVQEI